MLWPVYRQHPKPEAFATGNTKATNTFERTRVRSGRSPLNSVIRSCMNEISPLEQLFAKKSTRLALLAMVAIFYFECQAI